MYGNVFKWMGKDRRISTHTQLCYVHHLDYQFLRAAPESSSRVLSSWRASRLSQGNCGRLTSSMSSPTAGNGSTSFSAIWLSSRSCLSSLCKIVSNRLNTLSSENAKEEMSIRANYIEWNGPYSWVIVKNSYFWLQIELCSLWPHDPKIKQLLQLLTINVPSLVLIRQSILRNGGMDGQTLPYRTNAKQKASSHYVADIKVKPNETLALKLHLCYDQFLFALCMERQLKEACSYIKPKGNFLIYNIINNLKASIRIQSNVTVLKLHNLLRMGNL